MKAMCYHNKFFMTHSGLQRISLNILKNSVNKHESKDMQILTLTQQVANEMKSAV